MSMSVCLSVCSLACLGKHVSKLLPHSASSRGSVLLWRRVAMRRVTFLAVAQPFSGRHYRAICTSGFVVDVMFVVYLQCFDTVGWAAGKASGL